MSDAINDLIKNANKKFGDGMLRFGNEAIKNVPIICSSGSYKLDLALGCGGIPQGRIIEYFGPPSGGKTTLALHTMKEAQIKYADKKVAFIDLENSFDRLWATNLGINCDEIFFAQPETGEETFELIEMLIKSGTVSFIVVDSVSGMITRAQVESDYGDPTIAQQARLMSQSLPKINNLLKNSFTTVLLINQIRMKIGGYGNPEVTQGGEALRFYSSIRNEVRRKEVIGEKESPIGFVTKIKNVKNKVGPPYRVVETELYVGPDKYGIDKLAEVADLAVVNEIIEKSGAWFKYKEEKIQGRPNLIEYLRNNTDVYNDIYKQVFAISLKNDAPVVGSFNDVQNKIEEEKSRRSKKEETEVEEINVKDEEK
jgi:recombination protein RecA